MEFEGYIQKQVFKGRSTIELYQVDCNIMMKQMPDKCIDLAIVDPPYGTKRANNKKTIGKNHSRENSYCIRTDYKNKKWDSEIPPKEYFKELKRVSINQIIWGGNYFTNYLEPVNSWIIWNKINTIPTYSDGEMAWSSLNKPMSIVPLKHSGFRRGQTIGENSPIIYNIPFSGRMDINPIQKPVALYKWLLKNYAKPGDTILDTHSGSLSIAIACWDMGFDLTCFELDEDYFNEAVKRFKNHIKQLQIF